MWIMAVGKWIILPRQDWGPWFDLHPPESERWFEFTSEVIAGAWMMIAIPAPALLGLLPGEKNPDAFGTPAKDTGMSEAVSGSRKQ